MKIIAADQVVTRSEVLRNAWVGVDAGRIVEVSVKSPPHTPDHVYRATLLPGFVDIHCHGGGGFSFDRAGEAEGAAEFHLRHGTTSIIASLVSAPVGAQAGQLAALKPLVDRGVLRGVHLEGPFLSAQKCGAQNPAALALPTEDAVEWLLRAAPGVLSMVTIAPELPGALAAIERFAAAGVTVALGHSDADADTARAGIEAGARVVTHLFNAMRPLHHRDGSLSGLALVEDRLSVEVIADGVHVGDISLQLAAKAKPGRLIAITDAIAAAGMPDGEVDLGGLAVEVSGGIARLRGTQTLAGSTLTMDRAFSQLLQVVGLNAVEAAHATATRPAEVLGLTDVGEIAVGKRADLVAMNGRAEAVWQAGRLVA